MIGGLIVRVTGLAFTLIQIALVLRLILPFVIPVPEPFRPFVRPLIRFTNQLIAPFRPIAEPFDLDAIVELPQPMDAIVAAYLGQVDTAVIVAMVGWAIAGALLTLLLRLVFRVR